jgi:hypothetical protein
VVYCRIVVAYTFPFDATEDYDMQSEALEITMKLEASPVGENGAGMAQVQSQLAALTIQLQELVKGKEKHEEVWCVTCRTKGHHKNECPTFKEYLATEL